MSDKYNKEEPSVLQKIQNQTGCLLLIIGIAMLAFVLTDLLSSGQSIFGSQKNVVGNISGEDITYEEFNSRYETRRNAILMNNPGIRIDEYVAAQYREEIWNEIVDEKVLLKEFKALGLDVSVDEWADITVGANTHPEIRRQFTNQETGQFDKERLRQFLQEEVSLSDDRRRSWNEFQEAFTRQLVAEKYNALITASFYSTQLDARNFAKQEGQSYNAKIVSVQYADISDSTVNITDSDIRNYIKDHRSEYEQEESRDIEFIALRVVPSREDSMAMLDWAAENIERFKNATDDSAFVTNMNAMTRYTSDFMTRGRFSEEVENALFEAEPGTVLGPYQKEGVYSIFKVLETGTDSLSSVRGSQISIRIAGGTDADTAKAIQEARDLMAKINRGESNFEAEAAIRNADASRTKGGDIGWIRGTDRRYPEKLIDGLKSNGEDKMFVVKTNRGVFLAKRTAPVSRRTIRVAVLDQALFPSTKTDGNYYRTAGEFLGKAKTSESFEEAAESMGLVPRIASDVNEEDRFIPGLSNGNIVARWLFDAETEEGDISTVLDVDGTYVVAKVTKVREAGLPEVDDIRSKVETFVMNEKKADILVPKFEEALKSNEDAESLAKAMETIVANAPAVSLSSGGLPIIGQDNTIIGTVLGTPVGKRSGVVKGDNAVAVVWVLSENQFEVPDLNFAKDQVEQLYLQGLSTLTTTALEELAVVKDQRYRFYD